MKMVLIRDTKINRFEWHKDTQNFYLKEWPNFSSFLGEKEKILLEQFSSDEVAEIVFPATSSTLTLNYLVSYGLLGVFSWNDGSQHTSNLIEIVRNKGTSWLDCDSAKKFRFLWDNKWGKDPYLKDLIEFPQNYTTFFEAPARNSELCHIFFEFNGPDETFVETFEGEEVIDGKIYPFANILYYPCYQKKSNIKVDVPLSIKKMVLLDKAQESFKPSVLLSSSYYKKSLDSFTSWSFEGHRAQVLSVVSHFPDHTLVAPADGSGIVASLSRIGSVCGDATITDLTHPLVRKEDVSQTIDKGLMVKKPLFILSYCWTFLKVYDRQRLIDSGHPLVVIDSGKREIQFTSPSFCTHPGLYFLNVESFPSSLISFPKEKVSEEENIEYTENLLNTYSTCKSMVVFAKNKYYRYLTAMMPTRFNLYVSQGSELFPLKDKDSVVLCSSLMEVSFCINFGATIYWAPGGHVVPPIILETDFSMDSVLSSRMVYSAPSTVFLQSVLSSYAAIGIFVSLSFVAEGGPRTLFTVRKGTHRISGISKIGFFSFVVRSEEELVEKVPLLSSLLPSFPDKTVLTRDDKEITYYLSTSKNGDKHWSIDFVVDNVLLSTFRGDGLGPKDFKTLVRSSKSFNSTVFPLLLFSDCYYPLRQISVKTDNGLLPLLYSSGFKDILFKVDTPGAPNKNNRENVKKKK